jgi:hypothetical protein
MLQPDVQVLKRTGPGPVSLALPLQQELPV